MTLAQLLFSQGFGTRRVCAGLVEQGRVRLDGGVCTDPALEVQAHEGLGFEVDGVAWVYAQRAYLMLHKPPGLECSQRPGRYPSVYTLLPAPLRQRPTSGAAGVQAVGRLDQDTTGLLLLSDDGALNHRLSAPRHHVPKVYEVYTRDALAPQQLQALREGVRLADCARPVRAAAAEAVDSHHLRLTLTEGKYHQVKRMVAAVGNAVVALHRSALGPLVLGDLPQGHWRWLSAQEVRSLWQAAGVDTQKA